MSDLGVTLLWCAAQATLIVAAAAILHGALRAAGRSAAPVVPLTGLVVCIWLTATALGPWPSYLDLIEPSAWQVPADQEGAVWSPSEQRPVATILLGSIRTTALEVCHWDSQSLVATWPWARVTAMLFSLGLLVGLLQMGIRLLAVRLCVRRSHPLRDRQLVRLLEQLRREMHCRQSVEIRVSYSANTPATVGWLQPIILLPAGWRTWSEQERRGVLAHELAHIVHNDYLAVLVSQIGLALHFYHPLVHWLSSKMRLEQEFAADAVAASYAGGRRAYLLTLAKMALQHRSPESLGSESLGLARPFVRTRGEFLLRIEMLRGRSRPLRTAAMRTQVLSAILLLAVGLAISGVRGPNSGRTWGAAIATATASKPDESRNEPVERIRNQAPDALRGATGFQRMLDEIFAPKELDEAKHGGAEG